jgi:hypothetical protein
LNILSLESYLRATVEELSTLSPSRARISKSVVSILSIVATS